MYTDALSTDFLHGLLHKSLFFPPFAVCLFLYGQVLSKLHQADPGRRGCGVGSISFNHL